MLLTEDRPSLPNSAVHMIDPNSRMLAVTKRARSSRSWVPHNGIQSLATWKITRTSASSNQMEIKCNEFSTQSAWTRKLSTVVTTRLRRFLSVFCSRRPARRKSLRLNGIPSSPKPCKVRTSTSTWIKLPTTIITNWWRTTSEKWPRTHSSRIDCTNYE